MEINKKVNCPILDINGFVESGKQFDLEINLPEDNRNVIFGVVKDSCQEPVKDAVIKLIEIIYENGSTTHLPVTHTFTNKKGEFVLGPLCPEKEYGLNIFVSNIQHVKICANCSHIGKCLKGIKTESCSTKENYKEIYTDKKKH